jgi:hypothetical protein
VDEEHKSMHQKPLLWIYQNDQSKQDKDKKKVYGNKRKSHSSKVGARIESILALPRVIRRGNLRITEMLYLEYPKMRLTRIRQIRPCAGDMEGTVTIHSNVLQRRHPKVWNWLYL